MVWYGISIYTTTVSLDFKLFQDFFLITLDSYFWLYYFNFQTCLPSRIPIYNCNFGRCNSYSCLTVRNGELLLATTEWPTVPGRWCDLSWNHYHWNKNEFGSWRWSLPEMCILDNATDSSSLETHMLDFGSICCS